MREVRLENGTGLLQQARYSCVLCRLRVHEHVLYDQMFTEREQQYSRDMNGTFHRKSIGERIYKGRLRTLSGPSPVPGPRPQRSSLIRRAVVCHAVSAKPTLRWPAAVDGLRASELLSTHPALQFTLIDTDV